MRRDYQRMPQKREGNNPKIRPKDEKQQDSLEAINRVSEMIQWKVKEKFYYATMSILLASLLIIIVNFFMEEPIDKTDSMMIKRHYSEVMKKVADEPKDISLYKYKANVPTIVQKDINKMLEMVERGEDACIVYYNDAEDEITIKPSEESEGGYEIKFKDQSDPYSMVDIDTLESDISFYKSENALIIYGCEMGRRTLLKYYMDNNHIDEDYPICEWVDLCGTAQRYKDNNNDLRQFDSYFTLLRTDNEFSFYHLGEKLYSKNFEGGEIADWNFDYLTTVNGDCYNVYYSTNMNNCWIEFCKVAEKAQVLKEEIEVTNKKGDSLYFSILKIGNKKYAQIPNLEAEKNYGQNYGSRKRSNNKKSSEMNFTSELIELSPLNSSRVELEYDYLDIQPAWILYYYFQVGDKECRVRKRVNGLDSEIGQSIPQEKINMFNGKVISPDEIETYINQLRLLYDEYTKNEF